VFIGCTQRHPAAALFSANPFRSKTQVLAVLTTKSSTLLQILECPSASPFANPISISQTSFLHPLTAKSETPKNPKSCVSLSPLTDFLVRARDIRHVQRKLFAHTTSGGSYQNLSKHSSIDGLIGDSIRLVPPW
jgi:hypothetical protein